MLATSLGDVGWSHVFAQRYQDIEDMEDAVRSCAKEGNELPSFDTSCFSGIYVTGQTIDDEYFKKLHRTRNDDAKHARANGGKNERKRPRPQSNEGCESMNNDTRSMVTMDDACESITNQPALLVR